MSSNQQIRETLQQVRRGEPQRGGRVTVVPLIGTSARKRGYLTLEEALARKLVEVTEVSEGGSVPELRVQNKGSVPVLIVDGAVLIGAKQNRMVNLTILVPAESWTVIPVSCVESGRWAARTQRFSTAEHMTYERLRREKARQVSDSLRRHASRHSNQGAVWNSVSSKLAAMRSHSPTSAMNQAFEDHSHSIEDYVERFRAVPGQVGAMFLLNGEVVGLDLFDHAETFAPYLPKLLRGIALDALEEERERPDREGAEAEAGEAFLREVAEAEAENYPAVGMGTDVRLRGRRVTGGGLVVGEALVHLAAFREDGRVH